MSKHEFEKFVKERFPFDQFPDGPNPLQNLMMPQILEAILNNQSLVVQAPHGLGKTFGYLLPVIYLIENGRRVCILCPTKKHQGQVRDVYNQLPGISVAALTYFGTTHYICPKKGANATSFYCAAHKEECSKEEPIPCELLKAESTLLEERLVITNFAKFLSVSPKELGGFNVVVIDESHGFEDAIRNILQAKITIPMIEKSINELSMIKNVDVSSTCNVLNALHRNIDDAVVIVGEGNDAPEDILDELQVTLQDNKQHMDETERYIETNLQNPVEFSYFNFWNNTAKLLWTLQNRYDFSFLVYEMGILSIPRTERMIQQHMMTRLGDAQVILVSATIESVAEHAQSCGITRRRFARPIIWTEYPQTRRRRRLLLSLIDGPLLASAKETGVSPAERQKANRTIESVLMALPKRALVLFRSHRDCRQAESYLIKNPHLKERVHTILDEDRDAVEAEVEKLKVSDIVLASGSSCLWEGVDIPGLKLVIIDALPYIRPPPEIRSQRDKFRYIQRRMLRRLQQGLGRLVRRDDDWGVGLVVDRRLFRDRRRLLIRIPDYISDDLKNGFIKVEELEKIIADFSSQME